MTYANAKWSEGGCYALTHSEEKVIVPPVLTALLASWQD
jgi:hypothetical protein